MNSQGLNSAIKGIKSFKTIEAPVSALVFDPQANLNLFNGTTSEAKFPEISNRDLWKSKAFSP